MITIGVLTISDGASRGEREDLSGARIRELVIQKLSAATIAASKIIPDEQEQIAAIRQQLQTQEKVEPTFTVQVTDEAGELIAEVQKLLHVRKKPR